MPVSTQPQAVMKVGDLKTIANGGREKTTLRTIFTTR